MNTEENDEAQSQPYPLAPLVGDPPRSGDEVREAASILQPEALTPQDEGRLDLRNATHKHIKGKQREKRQAIQHPAKHPAHRHMCPVQRSKIKHQARP